MSKTLPALTLSLLAAACCTGALAYTGTPRAGERSDTEAAMHDGTVIGRFGVPARDVNPWAYPPAPPADHLTRAQVDAQTMAAIRNGTIIGRFGVPARNVNPWEYPRRMQASQTGPELAAQ